ncbi:MBL fold metallo-hydrolase [Paenibacillus sp. HN-1]|uniref:MBL fold metallo-hydrolase n=1 Tax=Paenibacillus TaxID=44249 RepID=UPI001CA91C46|nr:MULTISPECIES: MBL fold metallo-hydrolase [Paenibacillus]MBY9078173.1 MBL fold metallo-hydrolase [Paenibacillus sp. CGMCC 1.18879]MBY9086168.1 MBL fold metallo-hydrolase [Paenibacillus sinensis]
MNEPKPVTAAMTLPLTSEAFGPSEKTTIYWLAGAAFLINSRGTLIMIDPVLKTKPNDSQISEIDLKLKVKFPIDAVDVPKLNALLYTHSDEDHLAVGTALDLALLKPEIVGPAPVYQKLVQIGVDRDLIEMCRTGDQFTIGPVTVEVTPADHPHQLLDAPHHEKPFRKDDCCGFILNTPDGRFYFPGDTRLMEEHLLIKDIDVLALDVSVCSYHLNHLGATVLANCLKDALLIPYHYGTYDVPGHVAYNGDPQDVFDNTAQGAARSRVLAPGEPFAFKEGHEFKS